MDDFPNRVTLYDDGVYRWSYDMDMWQNRFMLRLVMKLLGIICGGVVILVFALLGPKYLTPMALCIALGSVAGLFALTFLIYAVCAWVMKGVYHLRFEMDESAVALVQSDATRERNGVLAAVAMLAGIAAGKSGEAFRLSTSLNAANTVGITAFSAITRVRTYPQDDVIALREWFGLNQIFVDREDYAYVLDYIRERISEKARRRSGL